MFIIFHVLGLTTGTRPAAGETFRAGHAYGNMTASFDRPAVALFHFLAMAVLGSHLGHGLSTVVDDFGVTGWRTRPFRLPCNWDCCERAPSGCASWAAPSTVVSPRGIRPLPGRNACSTTASSAR
ncbi:hypothetical protein MPRF_43790 [Mycolicibacterium parafortuitum]|uniref:Uncharacterized protein n=2 Tax=Mycolicibacterium parafortuitum TaxID=39692 RepID=A0A7I7U8I7_MYCPF|nr:hypothetical protein MPRF_43790 [Mycolicibacterium parafortuitum]